MTMGDLVAMIVFGGAVGLAIVSIGLLLVLGVRGLVGLLALAWTWRRDRRTERHHVESVGGKWHGPTTVVLVLLFRSWAGVWWT